VRFSLCSSILLSTIVIINNESTAAHGVMNKNWYSAVNTRVFQDYVVAHIKILPENVFGAHAYQHILDWLTSCKQLFHTALNYRSCKLWRNKQKTFDQILELSTTQPMFLFKWSRWISLEAIYQQLNIFAIGNSAKTKWTYLKNVEWYDDNWTSTLDILHRKLYCWFIKSNMSLSSNSVFKMRCYSNALTVGLLYNRQTIRIG